SFFLVPMQHNKSVPPLCGVALKINAVPWPLRREQHFRKAQPGFASAPPKPAPLRNGGSAPS
ncbi:MAG: hypothetical protein LUG15_08260, partial [Oscillospiraceae bacterium]|nr:hypothetical protein [Oscillospiraceae bacterium]